MQLSLELIMLELSFKNWHIQHILVHPFITMQCTYFISVCCPGPISQPTCISHKFWMIKLGSNLFVVLGCSMLISGSSQLKKDMLSIAVYVKLAQAYHQFQVTIILGIKFRSDLHWNILTLGYSTFPFILLHLLNVHLPQ